MARNTCAASSVIRIWRRCLAWVTAVAAAWPAALGAQGNPGSLPEGGRPIFCLHTEWMSPKRAEQGVLPIVIVRELGRQAVLIAARDELGLLTRDETLGEPFPESIAQLGRGIFPKVRGYKDGTARIDLAPMSAAASLDVDAGKPAKYGAQVVVELAAKFEAMSRTELPQQLRDLGFAGQALPSNEANVPPDEVEGLLSEMNFVSQFGAVRAAHGAIAEKGQSRVWLGVLVRGYAHLALMTQHHWKSDSQAFAARALLYAHRMMQAGADDLRGHAHLAYAQAVVGLHGAALKQLDTVDALRKGRDAQVGLPGWFDVLRPYCTFERRPVLAMVDQRKSLRELAQRLSFEQTRAYGEAQWLFDSAKQTMAVCPEDYSVYAALTGNPSPLGVGRTGAYAAPQALDHFLPPRIVALAAAPAAVREAAGAMPRAGAAAGEFAPATVPIVQALRAATASGDDRHDPSWSMLGELLFEEQFVQAANYLNIAMNATETSHAAEVQTMLPAVRGHRYAAHVESYALSKGDTAGLNKALSKIHIVDPRGNMAPLMRRAWRARSARHEKDFGMYASEAAFRWCGLTYPELLEAQSRMGGAWWTNVHKNDRLRRANDFRTVSPYSPHALRMAIGAVEEPTYEQARAWEARANDDPQAYIGLASIYAKLKFYDEAIRRYQQAIALSPSKTAFVGLAAAYRANQQEEMWQPTLERVFEIESLGLEHASVHNMIATDLMIKQKWTDAEPHAVAAAETHSAWGLLAAADVYEGLKQYDKSAGYVRDLSNNYPTNSGHHWYFWCIRNGQGDLAAAVKPAHQYFEAKQLANEALRRQQFFVYRVSKGQTTGAMSHAVYLHDLFKKNKKALPGRAHSSLQLALFAREIKVAAAEKTARETARNTQAALRTTAPDLSELVGFVCDELDGEAVTNADRAAVAQHLDAAAITPAQRCAFAYFIGRALELRGETAQARDYYRQSLEHAIAWRELATLAGMRWHALNKAGAPSTVD